VLRATGGVEVPVSIFDIRSLIAQYNGGGEYHRDHQAHDVNGRSMLAAREIGRCRAVRGE
jgi:hypothetical protein